MSERLRALTAATPAAAAPAAASGGSHGAFAGPNQNSIDMYEAILRERELHDRSDDLASAAKRSAATQGSSAARRATSAVSTDDASGKRSPVSAAAIEAAFVATGVKGALDISRTLKKLPESYAARLTPVP